MSASARSASNAARFMTIRLLRDGCTNRPFYRIVAINRRQRVSSHRYAEYLGVYDPLPNLHDEVVTAVNLQAVSRWLARGADVSKPVARLLGLAGVLPQHPANFMNAARRRKLALTASQSAAAPPAAS